MLLYYDLSSKWIEIDIITYICNIYVRMHVCVCEQCQLDIVQQPSLKHCNFIQSNSFTSDNTNKEHELRKGCYVHLTCCNWMDLHSSTHFKLFTYKSYTLYSLLSILRCMLYSFGLFEQWTISLFAHACVGSLYKRTASPNILLRKIRINIFSPDSKPYAFYTVSLLTLLLIQYSYCPTS